MKIYTKTGDKGETSLFGGLRVLKNHPRIQLYGELDSLNSHIGYLKALTTSLLVKNPTDSGLISILNLLKKIQDEIFVFGSHFATENDGAKKNLPKPDQGLVSQLEEAMDEMNLELTPLKNFILPGGGLSASYAHIVRTHTRLVERLCVEFIESTKTSEDEKVTLDHFIIFANRLSDYFFVVSRYLNKISQLPDEVWKR